MDPVDALRSVETRLRLVISERLGRRWIDELPEGGLGRLENWQQNEAAKRGAHIGADDLIDYTMTADLAKIMAANWDKFATIFPDRGEFEWLMRTVESVRNTIAHSRPLLPYERELMSGAAGRINQLVAMHRANANDSRSYYPLIERIQDNLGNNWMNCGTHSTKMGGRLDVGSTLTIQCASSSVRGKNLVWKLWSEASFSTFLLPDRDADIEMIGESVDFTYTVRPEDVSEEFGIYVSLRTDSAHTRARALSTAYDDMRLLMYAVNPND